MVIQRLTNAIAGQRNHEVGESLAEEEAFGVGVTSGPSVGLEQAVEPHGKAEKQPRQHLGERKGGKEGGREGEGGK